MTKHTRRKRVSTTVANPTRTAGQAGAGLLVAQLVDSFVNLNDTQLGLLAAVLAVFFSFVQNLVENYLGAGLLREVPEAQQPVVDPPTRGVL